ncbi:hypothetical protein CDL15_Pgr017303 [Punica granatum]|uniref:RNA cytidine acetyltransferase n=1 Tax=Punica granatum TaxID=22663 RepID=A0A218Y262_PUNGR|nr:hypothetical protein CDL15_Pgr017303 [Punica granatum]
MRKKVDERIRTLIENGVKTRHRSMFVIVGDKYRDQALLMENPILYTSFSAKQEHRTLPFENSADMKMASTYEWQPKILNLHYLLSKAVIKSRPTVLWCYKDKLELSSHKKKRAKEIKRYLQRGILDPEKADAFSLFLESGGLTYCLYKDSERILGNTFGMCILQDFEALTPNLLARTIETVEGGGLILLLLKSLKSLTSLYTMVMDVHERFRTESHSEATGRFNERFLLSLASCKTCVVMDDELNILPISSHIKKITPVPVKEDSEGLSEAERDLKDLKEQLSDDFPVGPLIKKCCTLDQGKAVITFLDAILDKTLRNTIALLAARGRGKSAALGLAIAGAVAAGYSNIFVTAPSPENLKTLFEFVCKGFNVLEYKEHIDYDVVRSANPEFKKATVRINIYKQHRQTIQYILPHESEKLSQVELLVVDEAAAIPLPLVKSLLGPYEGTGRSLSLKLIQQLEERSQMKSNGEEAGLSGRLFKKIELHESIRYASADPIESWLNNLLCLDVANCIPNVSRLPPPSECDLYYVNRDTLFSYHKDSELFLQRMMALYVASHYKNSPNDLLLMADAPAHHLFVLLGPVDESKNQLPDILCVIQLGYGSAAVELLTRYFEGQLTAISEAEVDNTEDTPQIRVTEASQKASLLEENVKPRSNLPPLLVHLRDRRPEKLHYLGVSFGLTLDLFRFWRRHKFLPFYVGQIPVKKNPYINAVTGEHTCMILKPLNNDDIDVSGSDELGFFSPFYRDFKQRFARLLAYGFRDMEYKLAMRQVQILVCFGLILDMVPVLSHTYFQEKLPVSISYTQASVLLCIGLQHRDFNFLQGQMKLENQQIMALFNKVMKKFYKHLYAIASKEIESALPRLKDVSMVALEPHSISVEDDLNDAAKKVEDEMRAQTEGLLNPELLQQYAIVGRESDLEKALQNGAGRIPSGGLVSVKSSREMSEKRGKQKDGQESGKRQKKDERGSKSNKKRKH